MATITRKRERVVVWAPQPGPQQNLINCPADEIFFGGARGGGKTDGMLGKFAIKAGTYGDGVVGKFFRKTREDLKEAIERSKQIYGPLGAEFKEQAKAWRFPNGARLGFEYLERDADADNYQGHNYTDLFFEEIQHWADPKPINKLRATLRSAKGIPCQFHATGNPGGSGHQWVKARYIDPAPGGYEVLWEEFEDPFSGNKVKKNRVFIPSKLSDNRYLGQDYVATLHQAGSAQLVKAWLLGDWSIIDGAYFDCWSSHRHVVRPFEIPNHWLRFRSMDWGSASPFSVGWWAVVGEDTDAINAHYGRLELPRGCLIRYREWYGSTGGNKGLKLHADEVADGIKQREKPDVGSDGRSLISFGVLDPSAFKTDGGPSIAERMAMRGVMFRPADNARVAGRGAMGGWDQVRSRLVGEADGRPMVACFSTCMDSIRTIPVIQHDPDRPEDVDTTAEDHALDEWRYACMARPWTNTIKVEPERTVTVRQPTLNEIVAMNKFGGGNRRI